MSLSDYKAKHFLWSVDGAVGTITLNRPRRKNPLTFQSYAEVRDLFRSLEKADDIKAVVITGAGGNFCSGGDVHEIIGPLLDMDSKGRREFTEMTGDLIDAILVSPQVVIAAIDGVCVGAGAAIAMACDIRLGTRESKVGFLFVRVGLAGCDMGACAMLPRIVGHGRAAELLYTGRVMRGDEAYSMGFFNSLCDGDAMAADAKSFAGMIAGGPTEAHKMTKRMLRTEWSMDLRDAVKAEARAQAVCMETNDFRRAYEAFIAGNEPAFEGD